MHIDSLKEQAAQLGILEVIQTNPVTELAAPTLEPEEKKSGKNDKKGAQRKSLKGSTANPKEKEGATKYKKLKKDIKEKQKMEDQLNSLKEERKAKLEAFKSKMQKKKNKQITTSASVSTDISSAPSVPSEHKASLKEPKKGLENEPEQKVDPKLGKPPKYKNPKNEIGGEPVHRLNHSEFNKIFQRKVKNRNTSVDTKKKKEESSKSGFATGSSREGSSEKNDNQIAPPAVPENDQKTKILNEREQRKKEELERIEKALQQIRFENYVARQKAKEKEAQMLRPSSGMKHVLGAIPNKNGQTEENNGVPSDSKQYEEEKKPTESDAPKKIEEQYGMEDEKGDEDEDQEALEDIEEVIEENEVDKEEAAKEMNLLKTMSAQMKNIKEQIIEKTQRIEEEIADIIENSGDGVPEPVPEVEEKGDENKEAVVENDPTKKIEGLLQNLSSEESEHGESDDEKLGEITTAETMEKRKLDERIKLLRHRCEAGIGNILFEKAYNAIKTEMSGQAPEVIRGKLISILGEENIGFYAIIDQILFLESVSA